MENILFNNTIIEPSTELVPCIRISPFSNKSIYSPNNENTIVKRYFDERLDHYIFTKKGREAISLALADINLHSNDIVTILTTSNNFYISSCVTKEIEKFCKWSRKITSQTKALFINHEFGYAYSQLSELKKKYNIPIIEDCAHSFFTQCNDIGNVGDYVIYSLPKAFPIQLGGILKTKRPIKTSQNLELESYICNHLYKYIPDIEIIKEKRINNFTLLNKELAPIGITPYFTTNKDNIPGVFLFKWFKNINYAKLKIFMQANGIESSVFYGENAYFIPIHQELSNDEIKYMCELLKYFYNND